MIKYLIKTCFKCCAQNAPVNTCSTLMSTNAINKICVSKYAMMQCRTRNISHLYIFFVSGIYRKYYGSNSKSRGNKFCLRFHRRRIMERFKLSLNRILESSRVQSSERSTCSKVVECYSEPRRIVDPRKNRSVYDKTNLRSRRDNEMSINDKRVGGRQQ